MPKLPMTNARRLKLFISYLPDWMLTIGLGVAGALLDKVDGFRRDFSLTDISIRYSFATHERVPDFALYMIAILAPAVLMPLVNLVTLRSWWDLHLSWLGLGFTVASTGAVTQVVKITVGRPRPDLLDRCKPEAGLVDPAYGLTTSSACHQPNLSILRDGFRSFFSGHSSLSFAGLGFLAFYLAGKTHLFDKRGHTAKAWLSLTPFMGAILVAVSRTMDYRHHWQDVLVGSIVGTLFAFFVYHLYFPPLWSVNSSRPYSPRIQREAEQEETLPIHNTIGFEDRDADHSSMRLLEPDEVESSESHHRSGRNTP